VAIEVASRELRNNSAALLRRVAEGEEIVITVRGRPAAQLVGLPSPRRRWLSRSELLKRLETAQADPGLRDELERLGADTTDDLGPIA
jgi:prevent-host-death family protein